MLSALYQYLEQMGYTHPLHPAATHIPTGCIIAAFLFLIISRWSRNPAYFQSARHCMVLALLFLPITALLGYMDWQHNYTGTWLKVIKYKTGLAGLLFIFLLILNAKNRQLNRPTLGKLFGYIVCLGLVTSLGYLGGELVHSPQTVTTEAVTPSAAIQSGADLFRQNCAFCHHHNRTERKVGVGLKGIFNRKSLPTSGWVMSDKNLRKQIKSPYAIMPAFDHLSGQDLTNLIDYIKSL